MFGVRSSYKAICRNQSKLSFRSIALPHGTGSYVMMSRTFANTRLSFEEKKLKLRKPTEIMNKAKGFQQNTVKKTKKLQQDVKNLMKEQGLHENIYTIPNFLTMTRLITAPVIGYFIVKGHPGWALGLFVYSSITDFVDGQIARRWNMKSVLGTILDPMADKSLMIIVTVCLAQAGQVPLYLATLIIGRDVLLGLSALYYRYVSLPPPKTFVRYWDFSIPSLEVKPFLISKLNTGLQMVYLGTRVCTPVLLPYLSSSTAELFLNGLFGFEILVATTTVISGLMYVFSKDAVKILNQKS